MPTLREILEHENIHSCFLLHLISKAIFYRVTDQVSTKGTDELAEKSKVERFTNYRILLSFDVDEYRELNRRKTKRFDSRLKKENRGSV